MSVLDIAGSTVGLLQASVSLVLKLREAYKDAKDIPQLLEAHEKKLKLLLDIVDAIDARDALKTATVTLQLESVCEVVSQIKKFLQSLSSEEEKGTASKVWNQLVHGKKNEKTLAGLMNDLDQAKANLGLILSVASIGVKTSTDDSRILLADPRVVKDADQVLVRILGPGNGLQLSNLIEGRPKRGDGLIAVTKVEVADLYDQVTSSTCVPQIAGTAKSDPGRAERIILANSAKENSMMINAPLGEDMWKSMNVRIIGNETTGNARMVNFPTTMENAEKLFADQAKASADQRAARVTELEFEERKQVREFEEAKDIREIGRAHV